eukprot:scaffold153808_cov19-Tisochrysis_lutea.AAC.2
MHQMRSDRASFEQGSSCCRNAEWSSRPKPLVDKAPGSDQAPIMRISNLWAPNLPNPEHAKQVLIPSLWPSTALV